MAEPITLNWMSNGASHAGNGLHIPQEKHTEAVDSAYELLQLLYDRGILDLLRGMVGAGDHVIDTLVEALDTPESVRAIRNLLLLTKLLGSIPPEVLVTLARSAAEGAQKEQSHKAPGFFELFRRLHRENTRHAIAVALDVLESVGKRL